MAQQNEQYNTGLKYHGQNRRLYERFSSRFPAKFKDTRNDFGTDVYLRDASAGGVRITTRERLYLNDHIALEVELPDSKEPLLMRGEVSWVRHKETDIWDAGLRFHKVNLMDLWRLHKYVEGDLAA